MLEFEINKRNILSLCEKHLPMDHDDITAFQFEVMQKKNKLCKNNYKIKK